jgi:polyhydroxyalkanoate synthesis regulator phasin
MAFLDSTGELSYEEAREFLKGIMAFLDSTGELSYEEAREFLKGIMAFLDSTGELSDEARAAFMEAMIEEEDSEEEDEGEPVVEEVIEAKAESGAGATMETNDNYTPPKSNYKVPEAKVMIDPIPVGPDGKPRLGRFGELLDENGIQILVNPGVIIGPDGKQLLLKKGEIRNPHDGEAFVGKYGEILDVEANAIVQQFNNIQNPKGDAILGHLTRGTEETKLTSAGGLLDPNGQPILGPKPEPGCLLDINGKPIKPYLNKYGERIDTGDGGDNSGSKFTVGEGMGDTGYSGSGGASRPDFQYQRPAETNSQKSNLRKAIAKKWEIKKPEGHDGFCPLLRIYRPRTSMKKKDELENLPAKVRRFKWVRDPISDQWIHVERIGEDARAA